MFSDENFLAQATFLVKGLKTGKALWATRGVWVVLTTLVIALLAGEMLSFIGRCCQALGWLSPSCARSHPFAAIAWG